jgi:hypothetical protein
MVCQASDSDRIREFLLRRGCDASVIEGGRRALLDAWETVAAELRGGVTDLDRYLRSVDARQVLDELRNAGFDLDGAEESRLAAADARFRAGSTPFGRGIRGAVNSSGAPWDAAAAWWYFAKPKNLDAETEAAWSARFGA